MCIGNVLRLHVSERQADGATTGNGFEKCLRRQGSLLLAEGME